MKTVIITLLTGSVLTYTMDPIVQADFENQAQFPIKIRNYNAQDNHGTAGTVSVDLSKIFSVQVPTTAQGA